MCETSDKEDNEEVNLDNDEYIEDVEEEQKEGYVEDVKEEQRRDNVGFIEEKKDKNVNGKEVTLVNETESDHQIDRLM